MAFAFDKFYQHEVPFSRKPNGNQNADQVCLDFYNKYAYSQAGKNVQIYFSDLINRIVLLVVYAMLRILRNEQNILIRHTCLEMIVQGQHC